MAEEAKARLVRCPKCASVIQELPDFSVYKCGSCGAILRAKKKAPPSFGSIEEKELDRGVSLRSASEAEVCRDEGVRRRKVINFGEKVNNFDSVSSRLDREKVFLDDDDGGDNKHVREHRHRDNKYIPSSKNPMNDNWSQRDDQDVNIGRSKSVNSSRETKVGDFSPKLEDFARSLRLKGVERDGIRGFYRRNLGTIDEQDRFSACQYPDEGPSSYMSGSVYGYHKAMKSSEYLDEPYGVQIFDKDRIQLLKKLNELKDQLRRTGTMPQRLGEFGPSDNKMASGGPFRMDSSAHHPSSQYCHDDFYGRRKMAGIGDSLSPCMHRRPDHQVFNHHTQQRSYSSRQYVDFSEDLLASYPNPEEASYRLPACSCLHCYEKKRRGRPAHVPPAAALSNTRFLKDPCSSTFNHYVHSDRVGQIHKSRPAKWPQLNFQDPAANVWPSDIDSDIDGFVQRYPRKSVPTCRNKRLCQPIASGAPFVTCYKCLELLKLPRNFTKMVKNDQRRLRCGACSTVIVFEMEKKRLIISAPENPKKRTSEAEGKPSQLFNGKSPTPYQEEKSPDNVIDWRDSPTSSELPCSADLSPTVSSLPNQAVSRFKTGNRTKQAKQEKAILAKNASRVVSEKSAPEETGVEVSFSGYLNKTLSQESSEASKEENQLKLHKGSKSFLVGLIRKSYRELSRATDNLKNERPNVWVNGQPISPSAVRKAEKQAGPIHPGNYWYDSRAGFWGVMGQPCSGIIPPFIEEFNYPMPENCGAGNTGVYINGRELHERDLELLACKGLPTTRDKSYDLEVSGRVLDEATGIQLFSLGKLAPTVEKEKRGFGMWVSAAVE